MLGRARHNVGFNRCIDMYACTVCMYLYSQLTVEGTIVGTKP